MNSQQFELLTTLFLLNIAKQRNIDDEAEENTESRDKINNNSFFSSISGPQLEPPTPPRTPVTASTSNNVETPKKNESNEQVKLKPSISLTPTSKLVINSEDHSLPFSTKLGSSFIKKEQHASSSDLDETFSDRGSIKAFDFGRFNDDSNITDDMENDSDDAQDSDMGLTIDSNNSFDTKISLPNTRKLMDSKSQTPLVSI